mgnify:FL=1
MGSPPRNRDSLAGLFAVSTRLFEGLGLPYFVIGGLAASVIGEPRFTGDIDLDVFVHENEVGRLLAKARAAGFRFNKKTVLSNLAQFGTFRLARGGLHLDVLRASTGLEAQALKRVRRIRIHGVQANFPSPEDLILLKLVPGREQDLLDARAVLLRHRKRLDVGYLEKWARALSDEAEDMRIYNTLRGWLEETRPRR